ncbi:MAG: ribosome silencing factor [Candidatus Margulisiibacteriota bacterium]
MARTTARKTILTSSPHKKTWCTDKKLISSIIEAAGDKLAKDIKVLDITQKSSVASYFIICTGESTPQIKAIADHIADQLAALRHQKILLEGSARSGWIILDLGPVLVHVMLQHERDYYKLEDLWGQSGIIYHE